MGRIAIVTTSYPRGPDDAAGHFVEAEARALASAGHDVVVLAPGPGLSGVRANGIEVKWLPVGSAFGWPGALERIRARPWRAFGGAAFVALGRRALAGLGSVDSVVAHWLLPSAWPVAVATSAPLEVVVHGSDVRLVERLPRGLRIHVARALLDRHATFRFVSAELRHRLARATTDAVLARSRVEPCRIEVSGTPSREAARALLGISSRERLAVVVGRLVPSKRPLEAVRLARSHASRVVVIGDGPLASDLSRAHPEVTITGRLPRSATLTWISAADLLVSASRDEGAPTVVREARALGAAVLAAPSGDLREWARSDPGITLLTESPL